MRELFQAELLDLQNGLVEIAEMVEASIAGATLAFNTSDADRAEAVIAADSAIDAKVVWLDEHAIQILARQQPVARDLRVVVSSLRISASLERMGDMSSHIAQLTRYRFPDRVIPKKLREHFVRMGEVDVQMAGLLVAMLRNQDTKLAEKIRELDDVMDSLHLSVFETVLGDNWKGEAAQTVDATLASRYHERFADHAVSIAKKVQYLSTGDWDPDHTESS